MLDSTAGWKQMYCHSPLREAPLRYSESSNSAYRQFYRQTLLEHCPRGGTALETGIGDAFDTAYLSLRGVKAFGIDNVGEIVERANQFASMIESGAQFSIGDLFDLYREGAPRWNLIHHMGVMEHFSARKMRRTSRWRCSAAWRRMLPLRYPACTIPIRLNMARKLSGASPNWSTSSGVSQLKRSSILVTRRTVRRSISSAFCAARR